MARATAGQGCGKVFLVVWLLGWTAGTLALDAFLAWELYHQSRTAWFVATKGVIADSEVTVRDGEEGPVYGVAVRYDYTVDGRRFTGDRYSYGQVSSEAAHDIVSSLPVDRSVTVYHDPANPADSVLTTGIGGFDLFVALFLTPFNIVLVGGWMMLIGAWRQSEGADSGAAFEGSPRPAAVLSRWRPSAAAGGTVLAFSFLATFVIGFSTGFNPSLGLMVGVWGTLVTSATAVYVWQRLRQRSRSAQAG
jgi:hypothetical protein